MHFSARVLRPPFEARSVFLQVTSGCSHNECKFCSYYKDVAFTASPMNEIKDDLEELVSKGYTFRRLWLQGADPFTLSFAKLKEIADLIHEYLPFVESIGCYSRVDSLSDKTVSQLKELKEAGYDSIVFGVESADDELLKYMNKGYGSYEIYEQLHKVDEADLNYTLIFLGGLGGKGYGNAHAVRTAYLFNKLHPERIMIQSLTLFSGIPLMKDDKFIEADEKERILELETFIGKLEIDTFIDATSASILTPFFGRIPENKEAMMEFLRNSYENADESVLKNRRNNLEGV